MAVKAKVTCISNEEPIWTAGQRQTAKANGAEFTEPTDPMRVVRFTAVQATDDDNREWSKWTPSGYVEMTVTNPAAFERFEPGKNYLLTFEEA